MLFKISYKNYNAYVDIVWDIVGKTIKNQDHRTSEQYQQEYK